MAETQIVKKSDVDAVVTGAVALVNVAVDQVYLSDHGGYAIVIGAAEFAAGAYWKSEALAVGGVVMFGAGLIDYLASVM